jgi:hypothetical protein
LDKQLSGKEATKEAKKDETGEGAGMRKHWQIVISALLEL